MPKLLENSYNLIALEAFSGTDLPSMLKRAFPQLVHDLKSFIGIANPNGPAIALSSDAQKFIKNIISKHAYSDISPLPAHVPQGLVTTYLEYVPALQASVEHASKILDETLNPYCMFLSRLLTNRESQLATQAYDYTGLDVLRDGLQKEVAKCFKPGSSISKVSLGSVIDRNADWTEVLNASEQMSSKMNRIDRHGVNKKIAEATELLDKVIAKLKRDELTDVTPEVVSNLSAGAYQIGKELEFFSVTYYRVLSFVEAVNATVRATEDTLK